MPGSEHYDAVVVGSGFGGSVTALRFAEAGLRVCVLERGKSYGPGDFPRTPRLMARNFWDPSAGLQGLFDVWAFRHIEAVVAAGLGGGSLIYANVLLRKDERWFVHDSPFHGGYEHWPISRADLDPHYDEVERMLSGGPLPLGAPGYPDVPKTRAMLEAAERAGLDCQLPNLAVSFAAPGAGPQIGAPIPEPAYGNVHGRPRSTCRLCGECNVGCNDGAKNTLDHTYLSAAARHGAELRIRCEVRTIAPRPVGGFSIGYVEHRDENEGRPGQTDTLPLVTVTADRLVLGAGALGTTYLLLRNRANFPHLGPALGTRFSGNGDLLGFVMKARTGSGRHRKDRELFASRGPVITAAVRLPDAADGATGRRGFYVEDAGYPGFVDWLAETTSVPATARRFLRFGWEQVRAKLARDPRSRAGVELAALIGTGRLSGCSIPLLAMGRDVPDGRLGLWGKWLDVNWNMTSSEEYFGAVSATMADLAEALGGQYHPNPMSRFKRLITVHPVGGTPMGDHIGEGVVNAWGESFTYPGLFVVDGAAMPGPVGANPSLTIAAFAERAAQRAIEPHRRPDARQVIADVRQPADDINLTEAASAPAPSAPNPDPSAFSFTEEMRGHVTLGVTDPVAGADGDGRIAFSFHLTMAIADIDRFLDDPDLEATATGRVECKALGGERRVLHGTFNLFVEQGDGSERMLYRLMFNDDRGEALTMSGYKIAHDDRGFDLWRDTTTLYVRLLAGHVGPADEAAADVVGAGVLHISPFAFGQLVRSMRADGPHPWPTRLRFMERFLGTLWDIYAPAVEHEEV